jgi:hypothetical protein
MATPVKIDRISGAVVSGQTDAEKIAAINASSEIQPAPESLRHLPARDLTSADFHHILALIGLAGEMKVAAENGGGFDIKILDAALAKTRLSTEDKIRVKITATGSGFGRS